MVRRVSAALRATRSSLSVGGEKEGAAASARLADALAEVEDLETSLDETKYEDTGVGHAATEKDLRLFARRLRDNGEALLRASDAVNRAVDVLSRVAHRERPDRRRATIEP